MSKRLKIPRKRNGLTLIELLVVLGIVAILIGLLFPSIQTAREAARKTACRHNIRQISMGVLHYEQDFRRFPPSAEYTASKSPNIPPVINGIYCFLLPYIEQAILIETYDFDKGYLHCDNQAAIKTQIPTFLCPSTTGPKETKIQSRQFSSENTASFAATTDFCNVYKFLSLDKKKKQKTVYGVFGDAGRNLKPFTRRKLITDGLSNTLAFFEKAGLPHLYNQGNYIDDIHLNTAAWAGYTNPTLYSVIADRNPRSAFPLGHDFFNVRNNFTPFSFHPGGVNTSMCDGSVRFLSSKIELNTWNCIIQKDDGRVISDL